jgi:hypothetical protein
MSVTCRRELMETDAKLTEQVRKCSEISENFDHWRLYTAAMTATHWPVAQESRKSMYLRFVSVSSE